MDTKIEFTYLSEEDMLKAGVTDMDRCIEVMEEMFDLLGKGDYVMGGKNKNSHGMRLLFPDSSPFPNMPIAGPDRRFMVLISYLGGRFNVCGEKWYGSNRANGEKGYPRSILMATLNDADTGAPLAYMSANLISSMRTGAIPAVGAKYLANKDSQVIGLVGAGVINRTCLMALLLSLKNIKQVKVYDIFPASAKRLCEIIKQQYDVDIYPVDSIEEAVRDADIVNTATSGSVKPEIKDEWLKDGVLISMPAGANLSKEFIINTKLVVDNWAMYEAWHDEYKGMPGGYKNYLGSICGRVLDYIDAGEMTADGIINLGDVVAGNKAGRVNKKEKVIFVMSGMSVEDVAWSYEIYQNALRLGIGTKLKLWDKPHMF